MTGFMLLPHNVNTRLKTNRFVKCVFLSILLIDQEHISEKTVVFFRIIENILQRDLSTEPVSVK